VEDIPTPAVGNGPKGWGRFILLAGGFSTDRRFNAKFAEFLDGNHGDGQSDRLQSGRSGQLPSQGNGAIKTRSQLYDPTLH